MKNWLKSETFSFSKRQSREIELRTIRTKRPWGYYTVINRGKGYKVKLIEVLARRALSLQFHRRRSEHWVVLEGLARVIKNKKTYLLCAGQSMDIPVRCLHRLVNRGSKVLKIIEVQAGKYLEEDDIVRLKDDFNRKVDKLCRR